MNAIDEPSVTLRVLTWNVENTDGDEARQRAMRALIAELDPDLVSLQEVVHTPDYDQPAELLAGTDLHIVRQTELMGPVLADQHDPVGDKRHLALASRWAPADAFGEEIPGWGRLWGVIGVVVPLPIGADLLFMTPNDEWALDNEAVRCAQAPHYAAFERRRRQPAPTIIAGDFDAAPDSDIMRFFTGKGVIGGESVHFRDAWAVAGDGGPGYTWRSENPRVRPFVDSGLIDEGHARRIDYVLVGSGHAHTRVRAWIRSCRTVQTEVPASDHDGVLAEIEFAHGGRA